MTRQSDERRRSLARRTGPAELAAAGRPHRGACRPPRGDPCGGPAPARRGRFRGAQAFGHRREAGESKASIGYHFGNKAGLVAALVDSLAHDSNRGLRRRDSSGSPRGAALHALIDGESRIAADAEAFPSFFDVLPHALRDPDLRERVAALYDGYRETVLRCPVAGGPDVRADLRPFAMLMIAIVDGLAIQHGLDPDGADVRAATELSERLAKPFLAGQRDSS